MIWASLEIESPQGHHLIHVPRDRQQMVLSDLLRQANLPLNTRCGQRGACDGCIIDLLDGSVAHVSSGERITASGEALAIRACSYRLDGEGVVRVRIPPRAMLAYQPQIVTDFRINIPRAHHPLVQIMEVNRADIPAGEDVADAICRIIAKQLNGRTPVRCSELARAQAADMNAAPALFATVSLRQDQWLVNDVSATPPSGRLLGAAIDIGTTTVVVLLVDLSRGEMLSRCAAFNQQIHLGDDVVTRITLCVNDERMTEKLQEAVAARTIAPLLQEAVQRAGAVGVSLEQIACFSITGNTTMLHLAAGVNPQSMGTAPFTPVFLEHRVLSPEAVFRSRAVPSAPAAAIHLLPSAAAYIGADLCAGILASGLLYDDGPCMLVDVGTNGEVILKYKGRLFGCATAAGPAFEGAGLSCGIRAGDGAISHINLSAHPFAAHVRWIAQEKGPPTGLCGSAYVDFLSEARRISLISPTGRYDRKAVPQAAANLLPWAKNDTAFRVALGEGKRDIVISQRDIAQLLQAKAAIAAGILTLLKREGLKPADIRTLYLAGGFGTHLAARNAIGCGLLPGFTPRQILTVGNSSLAGAYLALLDSTVLEELARIGRRLEVVELNLDPDFEACYIDQLAVPQPQEAMPVEEIPSGPRESGPPKADVK